MKRCTKCGQEKPPEAFPRDRTRPDGRFPWCRMCKDKRPELLDRTDDQRVLGRVRFSGMDNCWAFSGRPSSNGYGVVRYRGKMIGAHVAVYRILIGDVPKGKELDHLCRRRWCCNPFHLQPVTHQVNTLRGNAPTAINARKTVCLNGHAFTPENTYREKRGRGCRICRRDAVRRYAEKQRRRNEVN